MNNKILKLESGEVPRFVYNNINWFNVLKESIKNGDNQSVKWLVNNVDGILEHSLRFGLISPFSDEDIQSFALKGKNNNTLVSSIIKSGNFKLAKKIILSGAKIQESTIISYLVDAGMVDVELYEFLTRSIKYNGVVGISFLIMNHRHSVIFAHTPKKVLNTGAAMLLLCTSHVEFFNVFLKMVDDVIRENCNKIKITIRVNPKSFLFFYLRFISSLVGLEYADEITWRMVPAKEFSGSDLKKIQLDIVDFYTVSSVHNA